MNFNGIYAFSLHCFLCCFSITIIRHQGQVNLQKKAFIVAYSLWELGSVHCNHDAEQGSGQVGTVLEQ